MPTNKANKKGSGKAPQSPPPEDTRIPADQVLLDFLQKNKLVLIVDEVPLAVTVIPGAVHVVDKRPRVRVFYADQLKERKPGDGGNGEEIDIVH